MTANYIVQDNVVDEHSRDLIFAGDGVRLAGQVDYPQRPAPTDGFPLLFILHHAGCDSRSWYKPFAEMGLKTGFAVFRWDKRGTGRSGASGQGSTSQDAVNAYEIALEQPFINRRRVVILAQGAGTGLLGSSFGLFARLQNPYGVILASNMLDADDILAIDTRTLIVVGENDWNPSEQYAAAASTAHQKAYEHGAAAHVIKNADRKLLQTNTESSTIHPQALSAMSDWLQELCPTLKSI
ncbi:MAG: hypothetical protein K8L99_06805 [Anaerolineae bacterium]|nr:hypothetical protein [Anaerolineae bacterium]